MELRSIELDVPDARAAAAFLIGIWGAAPVSCDTTGRFYMRGSSPLPYLVALHEANRPGVRSTTFTCAAEECEMIACRAEAHGLAVRPTLSDDPGGGRGILLQLPEGEVLRFLHGGTSAAPLKGRDLPVRLTHIVMNAADAEATADCIEAVAGFRVSDRTKGMVFVRCNSAHHSIAFARAGFSSLNHIAFEMQDIDAVMRGIGRMRDEGANPDWGPGRHGPGANVFAYFVAPFGAVVEFSTAVDKVGEDHQPGTPEYWTWPANRIDQWGISEKRVDRLLEAEKRFGHLPVEDDRSEGKMAGVGHALR